MGKQLAARAAAVMVVMLLTLPALARTGAARAPREDQGADRLAVESSAPAYRDWTTIGAAGIVDEADQGMEAFRDGWVTMRKDVTGTLHLRYNVTAVEGLFGGEGAELGVRFRDNGVAARVVVRLQRYALETGDMTTLLTLDSDDFSAREAFQLRTVVDCGLRFDFFPYTYFLDVELRKTAATGSPILGIMQLASVRCW